MTTPLDPNDRHSRVMKNVYLTGIVCLTFILTGWSVSHAQVEEILSTPNQVVHQWLQSYPNNLDHAVTLTSPDFREDLTPSQWITQKAPILKNIRLEYLDSQLKLH